MRATSHSRISAHAPACGQQYRRGSTLLFVVIGMTALMAFLSLAIDFGRVQVVKTELQRAADAGARYGAVGLRTDFTTAQSNAMTAARENMADDFTPVIPSSVEKGYWDASAGSFIPDGTPTNALRVIATRSVPLFFMQVLGRQSETVTATSVVRLAGKTPNFIGLAGITAKN